MSKIFVSPVPTNDVDIVWDRCEPLLEMATERSEGREHTGGLYDKIMTQHCRLWVIAVDGNIVGSATTEVIQYTKYRSLHVSFLGGDKMSEWLSDFILKLKEYAKHNNCTTIEQTGRKGWLRELKKYGFEQEPFITSKLVLK